MSQLHPRPRPRGRRFSAAARSCAPHRRALVLAFVLVVLETLPLQAGPLLTQIGIDHGVLDRDRAVLRRRRRSPTSPPSCSAPSPRAWRVGFTGRLGERLMESLRVRVFSHFQRLSLDFFTGEKAGRLMTRMTSDIDSLTVLFQDGLVSLAVQGLTLLVITAILVVLNPLLALITIVLVVPAMLAMTLWFRGASDRTYGDRARPHRRRPRRPPGEPLRHPDHHRPQPPPPQRHPPPQRRRRLPRRQRRDGPGRWPLRLRHRGGRRHRPGAPAPHRRLARARRPPVDRRAHRLHPLPRRRSSPRSSSSCSSTPPTSRARPRSTKLRELLTTAPSVPEAPDARRPAAGRGRASGSRACRSATPPAAPRCSTTSTCDRTPARRSPSSARPARASRRSPSSSPASTTRPPAACCSTATTCAT